MQDIHMVSLREAQPHLPLHLFSSVLVLDKQSINYSCFLIRYQKSCVYSTSDDSTLSLIIMNHTTAVFLEGPVKHSSLAIIIQSYYLFSIFS